MDSEEITTDDLQEQAFAELLGRALPAPELQSLPLGLSERIAAATYARPSLWSKLALGLRPAPVRFALGGALTAAALVAVVLPRLPQSPVVIPRPDQSNGLPVAVNNQAPSTSAPDPNGEKPIIEPSPAPHTVIEPTPIPTAPNPKTPLVAMLPQKSTATINKSTAAIKNAGVVIDPKPTPEPRKTAMVVAAAEQGTHGQDLRPAVSSVLLATHSTTGQGAPTSAEAPSSVAGRSIEKAEADPVPTPTPTVPAPVATVARLPRTEATLASDEEERSAENNSFKISLAVTKKQMADAAKIGELRAIQQPGTARGTNLDLVTAPLK